MNANLWEIFVHLIENTMVAFLLFHRLAFRNSRYYIGTFAGYVIFSGILAFYCNLYQIGVTTTILVFFLFRIAFISLCFRNTFPEKVFTCCLSGFMSIFAILITCTAAGILTASNLTAFDLSDDQHILTALLYLFCTFLFMIVFLRFFGTISSLPKKTGTLLVLTTAASFIASAFFSDLVITADNGTLSMKHRIQLNGISIFILIIFLAILHLSQIIGKLYQESIKLEKQIHIYEKSEEHSQAVLQSAKSLQKWKHDYSNHLAVIHELIETKSYDRLQQYVKQQREELPKTFPGVNTGHPVIDVILTDKYAAARSGHISFEYFVVLPEQVPVSDIEITGILGNLLDNALEACKDIERSQNDVSPHIRVTMKPQRSTFHIHVENSCAGNYRYHLDGTLETTKKQAEHHGIGLSRVTEIAESHSGFCNITAKPDHFAVDVYIPLMIGRKSL